MSRRRRRDGAADRRRPLSGLLPSVMVGTGRGARRARPKHASAEARHGRRIRGPLAVFLGVFVLASGSAAFAYTTTSGSGTGLAQAVALDTPGVGSATQPTTTSLSLAWGASSALPPGGGYLVLRSTSPSGPFEKVSSGTCQQAITLVSTATSCIDTGLSPGTTYYYEVDAAFYDIRTLWVSAPDAQFSGTSAPVLVAPGSTAPVPVAPGSTPAPSITSANSTTFLVNTGGAFQATGSGSAVLTFSDAPFDGCIPSTLPSGVTFSSQGLLSGTPGTGTVGTYTVCINATNGVNPNATQTFKLTIDTESLVFESLAVSGVASSTPNLGPITLQRQTGSGTPITTGGALTVSLTSNPSGGAVFGTTRSASATVTTVTIPSGQSTVTFWFGSPTVGSPTITASATGSVSASQVETVTGAAPGPASPSPVPAPAPPASTQSTAAPVAAAS